MAKKIRFPLIMKDGIQVRTIEELRENFDMELLTKYFLDGKLRVWLEHRNYNEELSEIDTLKEVHKNISGELPRIFKIDFKEKVDVIELQKKLEKEQLLKQYTYDERWFEKIDYIAFNQKELETLVEKNNKVYLAGDEFLVNNQLKDKKYIGINKPILKLKFSDKYKNNDKTITFKNVILKSDSEINTCANIEKDCDVDENSIKTFARYTNDIKVYNAEDLYYGLKFDRISSIYRDVYLANNNIIYIYFDRIVSINLNTLESKEIYSDLRLCNYDSKCSHKIKDKIIIIEKSGIMVFNSRTLNIEKKLLENCSWIEKDLNNGLKVFGQDSDNKLIVYSNYTALNHSDKNLAVYKFDIYNSNHESERIGEEYVKYSQCSISGNKLYILHSDRKIVEFDEKSKRTIELEPPQTEDFISATSIIKAVKVENFITKGRKIFTIWGGNICIEFNYGVHNEYNKYILVYDLYLKEIVMSKKAHDIGIVLIYEINNMLITIDILGCLKMWNIDNLDLIGTIQLVNFDNCDYDDLYKYNSFIESVTYKEEFYMCNKIVEKMKETVIDYDEMSDKILIKYLDKVFILG